MNTLLPLLFVSLIFGNVNYVLWMPFYKGIVRKELVLEVPELPEVPSGKKLKIGSASRKQLSPTVPFKGPHRGLRSNDLKAKAPNPKGLGAFNFIFDFPKT